MFTQQYIQNFIKMRQIVSKYLGEYLDTIDTNMSNISKIEKATNDALDEINQFTNLVSNGRYVRQVKLLQNGNNINIQLY